MSRSGVQLKVSAGWFAAGIEVRRDVCARGIGAEGQRLKSTNLLERLNEELKRRTLVVRIFPSAASCLRFSRALAAGMHENWIQATRYLNMDLLREQQKERPHPGVAA